MSRSPRPRSTSRRSFLLVGLEGLTGVGFLAACGGAAHVATTVSSAQSPNSSATGLTVTSTSTVRPSATNAAPAVSASSAPPASGSGTVAWWMQSTGDDLKAFTISPNAYMQQHPNVNVQVTGFATGLDKVAAAIAGGDPPDLVQANDKPGSAGLYYKHGIQVLDSYIRSDKGFDVAQLEPSSMAGCRSYDGKQFAIPDQLYCHSDFFFDTSKFKEKGIDPVKPPQTLQELEAVAAQFDIHDGSQLMEVGFHPDVGINREMYPFAFGASFFDSKTLTVTPDHPGVIAGLQWLLAYYNKYGADNLQRIKKAYGNNQSAQNPFLSGKVAMTYFWDAMVAYRDRYAPSVEYDMAWAPYAGDHQEAKAFGNLAFNPTWMPVNAKNRDLAWDVLKFNSMDKESTIEVSIALANTPHLLTAVDAPGAAKADPILKKCWEYVAKGKMQFFPYQIPVSSDYYTAWSQQVSTILAGKVDVQAGLQQVKAMIQPKLDQALKG